MSLPVGWLFVLFVQAKIRKDIKGGGPVTRPVKILMPKKKQVVRFPKVFLVRESELPVRGGSMTELSGGVPICWQPKNPD